MEQNKQGNTVTDYMTG